MQPPTRRSERLLRKNLPMNNARVCRGSGPVSNAPPRALASRIPSGRGRLKSALRQIYAETFRLEKPAERSEKSFAPHALAASCSITSLVAHHLEQRHMLSSANNESRLPFERVED